jgi:hypothetical protein
VVSAYVATWLVLLAAGVAGLGLGIGIVIGTGLWRSLRLDAERHEHRRGDPD